MLFYCLLGDCFDFDMMFELGELIIVVDLLLLCFVDYVYYLKVCDCVSYVFVLVLVVVVLWMDGLYVVDVWIVLGGVVYKLLWVLEVEVYFVGCMLIDVMLCEVVVLVLCDVWLFDGNGFKVVFV